MVITIAHLNSAGKYRECPNYAPEIVERFLMIHTSESITNFNSHYTSLLSHSAHHRYRIASFFDDLKMIVYLIDLSAIYLNFSTISSLGSY